MIFLPFFFLIFRISRFLTAFRVLSLDIKFHDTPIFAALRPARCLGDESVPGKMIVETSAQYYNNNMIGRQGAVYYRFTIIAVTLFPCFAMGCS